jgi:hypothetical protein
MLIVKISSKGQSFGTGSVCLRLLSASKDEQKAVVCVKIILVRTPTTYSLLPVLFNKRYLVLVLYVGYIVLRMEDTQPAQQMKK